MKTIDPSRIKFLHSISSDGDGSCFVTMRDADGSEISSKAIVFDDQRPADGVPGASYTSFENEEFLREIMMGLIDARKVCAAIDAFHKAMTAASD